MSLPFASRLSLIAFAVIALRGLIDGSDFAGTTKTALMYGALFWGFGWAIGGVAGRLMEEAARSEFERTLEEQQQAAEPAIAADTAT